MKKALIFTFIALSWLIPLSSAYAVHVNGYYRSNGTYVQSYERTAPDGNPYNNYSYPGNYNPNTGKITGGSAATYLNNYYNHSTGGSYSTYNYSIPTTPSCPSMASYDSVSGNCKCYAGYLVQGNSCVSATTLCYAQTGYNSSYDSTTKSCKCDSGYVLGSSGQCINANLMCSQKIGTMSQYNSSTKQCECMAGYQFNGTSCAYKSTAYYAPTTYSPSVNCPLNSHPSTADMAKCQCNSGFQVNATKTACVNTYVTPTAATTNTNSQVTGENYYISNHTCIGISDDPYGDCMTYALNH